ncbi:M16 family metallopeptidase [Neolewinella antarctica]|uniref:Zn-dependent peptidase n=1 Tax=Neolewinella antarctica TaxID=442734 RepID=A0ABX0X922_9BACT|nr:pitrilysin family protein [Neolewinella antarctica]NJC25520.1 putative Zn-dependent peptidase [Neolewinella antarctica]
MILRNCCALLLVCLTAAGLTAQKTNIEFTEYELDNGLRVILHQDRSTPIVAVSVMYEVGGKDSFEGRTGFAHFFEHLLFEGTENIKERGQYAKYVQDAGGQLNANTSQDRTYYYEILPSNQLELGLWLESERLLHAKVTQAGVDTQRGVVKEERRERIDNQPYGNLLNELFAHGFTEHPYKDPNIGYMEDLNSAEEKDYKQFYKRYYVPNNAVLSIAGDIDLDDAKEMVEKYFATIPRGEDPPRVTIVEPALTKEVRDTVYDAKAPLPAIVMGYRTPERTNPDYYAISLMNQVLSSGQSSRLNKILVDEMGVAVNAGSFPSFTQAPGLAVAYAIVKPDSDLMKIEGIINDEVKKLQDDLISEREFQKLKNNVEVDAISGYGSMAGIAENLAEYKMYQGDANLINTETDRYMAVTREDIQRVAKKYYMPENRVVLYWLPGEGSK